MAKQCPGYHTLDRLKEKAQKAGLKYQTYISGILDREAGVAPRG